MDPYKADIFSAGILLFAFLTSGNIPQCEDEMFNGENLRDLMFHNPDSFWKTHTKLLGKKDCFFSQDFKDLFLGMTRPNPNERLSIEEIKSSPWSKGPIYTKEELFMFFDKYY